LGMVGKKESYERGSIEKKLVVTPEIKKKPYWEPPGQARTNARRKRSHTSGENQKRSARKREILTTHLHKTTRQRKKRGDANRRLWTKAVASEKGNMNDKAVLKGPRTFGERMGEKAKEVLDKKSLLR